MVVQREPPQAATANLPSSRSDDVGTGCVETTSE
jgi:hypothetical protein